MSVLVLVEQEQGLPLETSLHAVALAASLGEEIRVVGFGIVGSFGGTVIQHELLSDYAPEAWAESLHQLIGVVGADVVVAPGTERGNEVMAHLAAMEDLPLATNATEVDTSGPVWELTRVRWGGSLLERARLDARVKLLTVAPHSWPPHDLPSGESDVFVPVLDESHVRTRVLERTNPVEGITLTSAKVIVSGGRGVGSAEGFALLEKLAEILGGAVGCSRVVTNNGWRPHSDQVGQTGTRVAPDLYIACGISGAIQHWVGMMAAKNILAVNLDPEAPMMTKADYAVIGDLHEVLSSVIEEIESRR